MKKWLFILSSIFLMQMISANLDISPNPMTIDVQVNQPKIFYLTLNNTFPLQIFDFQFSNTTGFSFPEIILNPNQTKTINFTVEKQDSYIGTIQSKVRFNYYVDLPDEVMTHYVNITGYGYDPNYLSIRQGDTVVWKNTDDITHTVTSSLFDFNLQMNQTASYLFNQIGEVNYQDLILFFGGTIDVLNKTSQQKAHNPNYDKIWNINMNAILNPTTLEVNTLEKTFTVEATSSTEDLLKIKNIGSELAEKIHLSSDYDWIVFDETDFNLNPTQTKYITYTIAPIIFYSNETNQTHTINLKVKATNSEEYIIPINVSVPYSDIFSDFESDEGFLTWFVNVYCKAHPTLFICDTSATGSGNDSVIYRDPEIPINLTANEFYAMLKRIQRIEDTNQRTSNVFKQDMDIVRTFMQNLGLITNQSLEKQIDNERKNNNRWDAIWIFGFFIGGTISLVLIVLTIRKYASKKNLAEVYKYKRR